MTAPRIIGYSAPITLGGGAGAPADVWTWTNDMAPAAGDTRPWYGMLVDVRGQHVSRAGVTVWWALTAAGGNATLSAASSTTDGRGIATVDVTYDDSGTADDTIEVSGSLTAP